MAEGIPTRGRSQLSDQDWARWQVLGEINNRLVALYSARHLAEWWSTPAEELLGRSPEDVCCLGFDPSDPMVLRLVEMARLKESAVADTATADQVIQHAVEVRRVSEELGFGAPRLRHDGTVIVPLESAAGRDLEQLTIAVTSVVGVPVHVGTDDLPGAKNAGELRPSAR